MAYKEAAKKAKPVCWRRDLQVQVTVPEEYMAHDIGDLNPQRRHIEGMRDGRQLQAINGHDSSVEHVGGVCDGHAWLDAGDERSCSMEFKQYEGRRASWTLTITSHYRGSDSLKARNPEVVNSAAD